MKVKEADILIVPGFGDSGAGHWQTRWQSRLSTARRMHHPDWESLDPQVWTDALAASVNISDRPVVLVGHALGVTSIIAARERFTSPVAGAFLVAPPDIAGSPAMPPELRGFGAYDREPLPFPSILIASRNDLYCSIDTAEDLGGAWGSLFIDAGEAGHIDAEAGYGPWPEGSMTFASFLSRL